MTAEPRNERERKVEEEIETMFRPLEGILKGVQHREIAIEEVKRAVKGLKKKKTGDKTGLRNEMIQWAGKDFIESIKVIFEQGNEQQRSTNKLEKYENKINI